MHTPVGDEPQADDPAAEKVPLYMSMTIMTSKDIHVEVLPNVHDVHDVAPGVENVPAAHCKQDPLDKA